MRSLDVAFAPSAQQYAADLNAAGAQVVALYLVNYSAPSAYQQPGYFTYLRGLGFHINAIVVPGNGTPAISDILGAASAAGLSAGDRVELDIEPGSYPPAGWVASWQSSMRGAGFSPGQYSNAADTGRYGGFDWYRLATLDGNDVPPPAGYVAIQWGQQVINGTTYDVSNWLDSFWTVQPPVAEEEDDVRQRIFEVNGQQRALILAGGALFHRWYDPRNPSAGWQIEVVFGGGTIDEAGGIDWAVLPSPAGQQLHAVCRWANTSNGYCAHGFQLTTAPGSGWGIETL